MKSEPVNYSICNAVRIADTIINNRIVMQIISDKLILLFPQSKLQNTLQNIDTAIPQQNMTECSIPVPRYVEKGSALDQGSMHRLVQVSQKFTGIHWSESSLSGFWYPASKLCFGADSRPRLLDLWTPYCRFGPRYQSPRFSSLPVFQLGPHFVEQYPYFSSDLNFNIGPGSNWSENLQSRPRRLI